MEFAIVRNVLLILSFSSLLIDATTFCGDCEQDCNKGLYGEITCKCRKGFKLSSDGKSCEDINECSKSPCKPKQKCNNTAGGFECLETEKDCMISDNHFVKIYNRNECCYVTEGQCGQGFLTLYRGTGGPRRLVNRWSWAASLYADKSLKCTGMIIGIKWVVMPSDCVRSVMKEFNLNKLRVKVGLIGSTLKPLAAELNISKVISIPDYSVESITLIELNESLAYSLDYIHQICMPENDIPEINENCVALGFAQKEGFRGFYESLNEIPLTIKSNSKCREHSKERDYGFDADSICAENKELDYEACLEGKRGGFLICQRKNSCDWYLAGVKYRGRGCAGKNTKPTTFLGIRKFEALINNHIKQNDSPWIGY